MDYHSLESLIADMTLSPSTPSVIVFDKKSCTEKFENTRRNAQRGILRLSSNTTFLDSNSGGPSAKLEDLTVVTLPELVVGDVNRGRVLYGSLCTKPIMLSGVHTILEDEFGNGVDLSVYNAVRSMASPEEIEAQFPVGLEVAIKEPYLKWASDGQVTLRVDNPVDVVRIRRRKENEVAQDGEFGTLDYLHATRCEGNDLFQKDRWVEAVAKYSDCIDEASKIYAGVEGQSESFRNVLKLAYSNRAASLLRLQNFEGALSDAEKALNLDSAHVKTLYRLGCAAREMGLYEKACRTLETALALSPQDNSVAEELQSSRDFLEQSRPGVRIIDPVSSVRNSCVKYAEYIVPVEIRRVSYARCGSEGGRGLFAKEAVTAYSMVIVTNAMAWANRVPADLRRDSLSLSVEYDLLVQLIQRAAGSERSMAQLYSLASNQTEKMELPSMELFELGSQWTPPSANTLQVNVTLIKKIIKENSFGATLEQGGRKSDAGLWILPSFMNHSCVPNCLRGSLGNVMLARAVRNIEAGEEVTICYFQNLFTGFDTRQEQARELRFTCKCERCNWEKQLDPRFSKINAQVRGLVSDSKKEFHADSADLRALEVSQTNARSFKAKKGGNSLHKQDWGWEGWPGTNRLFIATRQLAKLATQVENLIGSLDAGVAAHQRSWIRASFLDAYLAKYVLETASEPDASTGPKTLSSIVEAMIAVLPNHSTSVLSHLLFTHYAVNSQHGKKSRAYKAAENLNLQVIRVCWGEQDISSFWSKLKEAPAQFNYSKFSFS